MQKLFVLGDSISIGYGPFLKEYLRGVMEYDRKSGEEEALKNLDIPAGANGGDSRMCLAYLEAWAARGGIPADSLLLNCGLHDLKWIRETQSYQVPVGEYEANLSQIVAVVKRMNARVVWVRTTPVNDEDHRRTKPFDRKNEDVVRYNAAADKVMNAAGASVCDLYTLQANSNEGMSPDGVHFNAAATQRQAAYIAGFLSRLISE